MRKNQLKSMKFTIGIPAYKSAFLKQCIDSVLAQTYLDFELIIVNDASPENIDEIVQSYQSSKIRYYRNQKNFGAANVVDNWNKCLSFANGEFFILLGDDDVLMPEYLQEFSTLTEKFPICNVYHCRTLVIDKDCCPLTISEPRPEFESVYDSILERMKGNRFFFISDYVFRTNELKKNGGFYKMPLAWASDDISSYIAAERHGTIHTDKLLFMYRQNAQTISSTGNIYLKMQAILDEKEWLISFIKHTPTSFPDIFLRKIITREINLFIQKKKIRTIYTSTSSNAVSLFWRWFFKRKKYDLTVDELIYATFMYIKENRKKRYE